MGPEVIKIYILIYYLNYRAEKYIFDVWETANYQKMRNAYMNELRFTNTNE